MDQDSDITSLFQKLNKLRGALLFKQLKEFELTSPQLFILMELFSEHPRTLGNLAKAVDLSNSTVSGIIDRLEMKGLIERKRDENDRRVVWIYTTTTCQLMKQEKLETFHREFREEFLNILTPEQLGIIRELFKKLVALMEKKLEGNA
jgi:MarR family transcriptional regulator, organic hydroperoxide resistance regulator